MAKGKKRSRPAQKPAKVGHSEVQRDKKASQKESATKDLARDSTTNRESLKRRLKISQLERAVEKEEQRLRSFKPENNANAGGNDEAQNEDEQPKKKGRKGPESWVLRGAARPAALLAKIESGELLRERYEENMQGRKDLIAENEGHLGLVEECHKYLRLLVDLAEAEVQNGNHKQAISTLEKCMKLDEDDHFKARHSLVMVHLDEGNAAEAREVINKNEWDRGTVFSYALLLIEYVAHKVLEEDDASETVLKEATERAVATNPHLAYMLAYLKKFESTLEDIAVIEDPAEGTIEEAFGYLYSFAELWADVDGLLDYLKSSLEVLPTVTSHECTTNCITDEANVSYRTLYEKALKKACKA